MPLHRTRLGVALATFVTLSCTSSNTYVWREGQVALMPTDGLVGAQVMILPLNTLVAAPGVDGAGDLGPAGRARVDSMIFAILTQRAPDVQWIAPDEVRSRAEADRSLPHPDSLPIHLLTLQALMGVSAPLLEQMRKLVTSTSGRYMLVPVRVTYRAGRRRPARAELTVLLVNTRVGAVAWKSDVAGEANTPLDALTSAIVTMVSQGR